MKKLFGALTALLALIAVSPARAETYPDKPVRIITDSAAGSATDVTLRVVGDQLGRLWGQQVVTLNQVGGGGSIAARVASQAPNDGYTLYLVAASTFTALAGAPGVATNLPIQIPRDFTSIGFVTQQPMVIAVAPNFVKTLPEMIALAKQKPGEISYATTGRGRITHLTMELLQARAGIKLQMVPYSGGPAQAMNDVMGGRIPLVLEAYSGLAPGLQGGAIRGLAVASPKRLPDFPDLPTVAETLPGFEAGGWNVLVAPVGTPDAIIQKVSVDLRKVIMEPEVIAKLAQLGAFVRPMTPAEVTAYIQEQQATWKPIAEKVASETQH